MESNNPGASSDNGHGQQGQGQNHGQQGASRHPIDRKVPVVQDNDNSLSEQETFGNQQPYAQPPVPPYAPPQYEAVSASAPFPSYQHEGTHPFDSEATPFLQPQQPMAPYAVPNAPYQFEQTPRSGHPQYYPQPPYPQQPFPQHPYPSYGAIPGAGAGTGVGPSYPSPFPLGQRLDDQRRDLQHKVYDPRYLRAKRKKRESCCKKCCCWIILLMVIAMMLPSKKFNWFPGGIEGCDSKIEPTEIFAHSFAPLSDGDLKVHVKGDISSNVKVVEASSPSQDQVVVKYEIYASDSDVAYKIKQRAVQRSSGSSQESGIDVENLKFPRYGCANVAIEISYPHQLVRAKGLNVKIFNGNIQYDISDPQRLTLDELTLGSLNGGISFQAAVERSASFKLLNGHIHGQLAVGGGGNVRADTTNGGIDVVIASHVPEKLDVKFEALNGQINTTLLQEFEGHFTLASTNGRVQLLLPSSEVAGMNAGNRPQPPPVNDPSGYHIVYKNQRVNAKEGWMSYSGTEPSGELPRVRLSTLSGAVTLRVKK